MYMRDRESERLTLVIERSTFEFASLRCRERERERENLVDAKRPSFDD